ncbi:MAG: ribosome maturation factor RimP [Hyphomonadaceae bacterium]|jgi:ribosome maturation factor RimP|nr:ribosome maturation factor RimP [Hyphomonadaceae bacterium]
MRTTSPFEDRLLALIEPAANDLGYAIVRIRLMAAKRKTLQIMAERLSDGGMGASDCEKLSRSIAPVLDAEDPIDGEYSLEVSSPGIDRPLTRLDDFTRWTGWEAKIELDRLADGRKRFTGVLAGVEDGAVGIDLATETDTIFIPFDWIETAKLVLTDALIRESLRNRGAGQDEIDAVEAALTDSPAPTGQPVTLTQPQGD